MTCQISFLHEGFVHASGESSSVQVSESTLDMNDLLAPLDTEPAFKTRLRDAAVLVIPTDLRPEYDGPVFPDTTREVFRRLQEGLEDTATVDALVKDEDYVEYQYNSEQIQLPVLLVHSAVVSFVINILASYVYDRDGLGPK